MSPERCASLAEERFGLVRLSAIAGVTRGTIQKWTLREAIHFEPIGSGKVRSYTILDAIHLAIIAEMRKLGMTITGEGADFSRCLLGQAKYHLFRKGSLEGMRPVALQNLDDGCFAFFRAPPPEERTDSYVVIGLRRIIEGVLDRHKATGSLRKPAQPRRASARAGERFAKFGP